MLQKNVVVLGLNQDHLSFDLCEKLKQKKGVNVSHALFGEEVQGFISLLQQADLVLLVVSPTLGLLRHDKILARQCHLAGVKRLAVVVAGMEEISCDSHRFAEISESCVNFFSEFSFADFTCVPDVTSQQYNCMSWYKGQQVGAVVDGVDSPAPLEVKDTEVEESDSFTADIHWIGVNPLLSGREFLCLYNGQEYKATVMDIKKKIDVQTGAPVPAEKLFKMEFATVDIAFDSNALLIPFGQDAQQTVFELHEKNGGACACVGTIRHILRRATNVVWQAVDITREIRSQQKEQQPKTLWFTGLSGSGKSTIANAVEKKLVSMGYHTMLLDGDNVRHGLNKNLGFKEVDRIENIRRVSELAKILNDAGVIVLASFIAPYESDRRSARKIIGESYVEVHVSTPLEECERRDVKGLYQKARSGEIPNFTGITAPYEMPAEPQMRIDTTGQDLGVVVDMVMAEMGWEKK